MKAHTVTARWWDHATLWNADDPSLQDAGHSTDGGRVFGITRTRYAECDRYGCSPVVVIDPDDREVVRRLTVAIARETGGFTVRGTDATHAALLSMLTTPAPPKPPEPTGLGAVVEDESGKRFVRGFGTPGYYVWRCEENFDTARHRYADIAAVRVLSEGVTP